MKKNYLFFFLLIAFHLQAQCNLSLSTPYNSDNSNKGVMFNIVNGATPITITSFDMNMIGFSTGVFEIYYKSGTYFGSQTNSAAWTLAGSTSVTSLGNNNQTPIPLALSIPIPAITTFAFYITNNDASIPSGVRYTNGTFTNIATDSYITIQGGIGKAYPFGTDYNNRKVNCTPHYYITNTSLPTITTSGTVTAICSSTTSQTTSLSYTGTTNNPVSYSIDWNAAANTANLIDQGDTVFSFTSNSGSINTIAIPADVPSGTYTGTLAIKGASGCDNDPLKIINLTVNPISIGGSVERGIRTH